MATVFLGLGSNQGNRQRNLSEAIQKLTEEGVRVLCTSSVIETDPVGGPLQDKFLNAVLKTETLLNPMELLTVLQTIEKKMGRIKTVQNGPRTIDLDILLYDHLTFHSPELTIPHPRMFGRDFVMIPLKEIAPEIIEEYSHARH